MWVMHLPEAGVLNGQERVKTFESNIEQANLQIIDYDSSQQPSYIGEYWIVFYPVSYTDGEIYIQSEVKWVDKSTFVETEFDPDLV